MIVDPTTLRSSTDRTTDRSNTTTGEQLREARIAKGLSVEDIVTQLNLTTFIVEAYENNRYEDLPKTVHVVGHLRSYAQIVGIDSNELIASFKASYPYDLRSHISQPVVDEIELDSFLDKHLKEILFGSIVLLLLVILAIVWFSQSASENGLPSASGQELAPPKTENSDQHASPSTVVRERDEYNQTTVTTSPVEVDYVVESLTSESADSSVISTIGSITSSDFSQISDAQPVRDAAYTLEGNDETSRNVNSVTSAQEFSTVASTDVATSSLSTAASANVQNLTDEPLSSLKLEFSEQCWVEVRDRTGELIFNGNRDADDQLILEAVAPLSVKLGNAPGVLVTFEDEVVDLAASTRNRVANLVLE